jgi:hypothetical protein
MRNVIGIDADRQRLAVVALVDGVPSRFTIDRFTPSGRLREGYHRAVRHLMERASKGKAVIFLEGIFLAQSGNRKSNLETFRVLANVQGELLYEAAGHGVDVRLVPPAEWQKRILGFCADRKRLKAASAVEARRMLQSWDLTEHESDAACICKYGRLILEKEAALK